MKINTIYPSKENLTPLQKWGLERISSPPLNQGREIVLAIDRTESVKIEEEGRTRITQIIRDALKVGDRIYIVDFATEANFPVEPIVINSIDDKNKILNNLSFSPDITKHNTDIQNAEWTVYRRLAVLNQERLISNRPVYRQSVIWMTDAPLFTQSTTIAKDWEETPFNSVFRDINSAQSKDRNAWLESLPFLSKTERSHQINGNYKLTVVDIAPTVQEICTYAPSGQNSCLVTPYLTNQLGLPLAICGLTSIIFLAGLIIGGFNIYASKKQWKISINGYDYQQMLSKYELGQDSFDCGDSGTRGYLVRRGKSLWIEPIINGDLKVLIDDVEIQQKKKLLENAFTVKLLKQDGKICEFAIKIIK